MGRRTTASGRRAPGPVPNLLRFELWGQEIVARVLSVRAIAESDEPVEA
jgi:hypothetical protein